MAQKLDELRKSLKESQAALLLAQNQHAAAVATLAKIRNTGVGNVKSAQATVDKAKVSLNAAQAEVLKRRGTLDVGIANFVGTTIHTSIAPADVPVALLPVGIETRFDGNTLLVRVIPDEIHVEDHEPELTDEEVTAGRTFWHAVWREPDSIDAEKQAWASLAAAVGSSRRASWIVDQTAPPEKDRPKQATPPDKPLPEPDFPDPPRRPAAWSQPAMARSLPDRFIGIAYRRNGSGGSATWNEIARAEGKPVADAIQLGLGPGAAPPAAEASGPALPDGMRWIADIDAAEQAGLLLRVPLPAGTERVDRLVVLGVLTSLDAEASASRLAKLLSGHHYSSGLEVLPIGAPSNNTAADTSAYSGRDDPLATFAVERRTPAPADGTDGALLARALGIPAETFRGVAHSNDSDQAMAGQFNALVWPSAMGYWFDSLVQPGPSDAFIADLRRHAVQMVRGRGPLSPLRVGRQPYGVLPVTSIHAWQPANDPAGVVRLAEYLRRLYPWWLEGIAHAPVVRAGADPDSELLDALGQLPVSTSVAVRSMVGANVCYIPAGLGLQGNATVKGIADEANNQRWLALVGLRALGVEGFPYLGQLVANSDPVPLLHLPYTVDPRLPTDQKAAKWQAVVAYLKKLRTRRTGDFQSEDPRTLTSVLTLLARRSVMLERVRAGLKETNKTIAGELVEAHLRVDSASVVDAELISTTATLRVGQTRSTGGALLASTVKDSQGGVRTMVDHLDQILVDKGIVNEVLHADYADTLNAAEAAASLSAERAALLLGEALDTASHRYDAWVTSLATRRLDDLRAAKPTGVTLGAYGAVEGLERRAARENVRTPPKGAPTPLVTDTFEGGFIHAPSLPQAASAAVLRAGHLSHAADDPASAALAIDLSSARVRTALGLLDGVREGQSLGALLGYRAERQLHELGAHTAVEAVRRLAPPPVVTGTNTPEGVAPRAVCDGLALSQLDRAKVLAATHAAGADNAAVGQVLDTLDDAVDAVADLLLAESVHQIVRGNPDRASAALSTLNHGEGVVSEPELVKTPRGGTSITQRVAIAIGPDAPTAPRWPSDGIRATAEPRLSSWAGHLLGDPSGVAVSVKPAGDKPSITFPLTDLHLGPLDLVYEPPVPRALRHARSLGAGEGATVDLEEPGLAALLAMANLLNGLLTRARPGAGVDLARPQDCGSVTGGPPPNPEAAGDSFKTTVPDVDGGKRRARLDAARARLSAARDTLNALSATDATPHESTVAAALNDLACFGITPGSDPARVPDTAALLAARAAASDRLEKSIAAPDDSAALFGEGFHVLALAAAPFATAVNQALASDPVAAAPAEVLAPLGGKTLALHSWLETTGRVRTAVGRLADVLLAARLRGSDSAATLHALQLPTEPFSGSPYPGQWVGLGFPGTLDPEPVTSFVLHTLGTIDAARGIALLVIDEYMETVPAASTSTGLSFGFDAPGARPPQSVLLAVPPVSGTAWSVDTLANVIGETLDLAKMRMVDLSAVAWAGRFAPTIYLTDGDVPSGLDLPMKEILQLAEAQFVMLKP